ncbi:hypothetical protein KSP40_PGU012294 [Platanthera guangdongensis]|uniref:HMA domain-containing protein n=1 Tax=Platanthera guangdongensis TaxID=2320717 RepID=A0ABR2MBX2_9ASPA
MFLRRIMTGRMWSMLMVKVKERMRIVGLEVVQNRQVVLISLQKQTLTEIKAVLEEEGYRRSARHGDLRQPPPLGLRRWRWG